MRSKEAQREMFRGVRAAADYARGVPSSVMTLSAGHAAESHLGNAMRLPVQFNPGMLQYGSGAFLFLVGFSQVGGPDLLA